MGKNLDDFFDNALELEETSYEPAYEEPVYEEPVYEEPAYEEDFHNNTPSRKALVNSQSRSKKPRVRKAGEKPDKVFTRPAVFEEAEEEAPRRVSKKPAPRRGGSNSSKAAAATAIAAKSNLTDNNSFEEELRPARPSRRPAPARRTDSARPANVRALKPIPPASFYDDEPASAEYDDYDDYDEYEGYEELDEFDDDFNDEEPEVKQDPKRRPKNKSYDEELDEFDEDIEERPRKKPLMASKKKAEQIPGESSGKKIDQGDNKKKRKNLILIIIIIIAAGVLIFSGIKLFQILGGYKEGSDTYKKIENIVKPSNVDPDIPEEEIPFSVDMQALIDVNPDAKGYIYGKGLFSYPIVQGGDNSYYLTHLFDGTENSCGCLFIDANLPEGMESRNCIVYGHNMNDGSMFAPLHQYGDESFYKDHKEFEIFTNGHHYIYKMLSCFVTPVDGIVYTRNFGSDEEFVNFLYDVAGTCPYETEYPELNANSKVMTLSTCLGNDDDDHRFVVVLIRDHEVIDTPTENTEAPEETQAPDVETEIPEEDL